jgi:hypothetical protein
MRDLAREAGDVACYASTLCAWAMADVGEVTNTDYKKTQGPSGLFAR